MQKFTRIFVAAAVATTLTTGVVSPAFAQSSDKKVTFNGIEMTCGALYTDSDFQTVQKFFEEKDKWDAALDKMTDEQKAEFKKLMDEGAKTASSCGYLSTATATKLYGSTKGGSSTGSSDKKTDSKDGTDKKSGSSNGDNTTTIIAVVAVLALLGAGAFAVTSNPALMAQLNLPK